MYLQLPYTGNHILLETTTYNLMYTNLQWFDDFQFLMETV
jgi:hypothetical protein